MTAPSADALAERLFHSTVAAFDLLAVHAGDRMGWYAALAERPLTAPELAAATGTDARYAREWLEHQAAGGVLGVDDVTAEPDERRYALPAGHAEALLDSESLNYAVPFAKIVAGLTSVLPELLEAYRTGGGVPWEAMGTDALEAQAAANRPLFKHLLTSEWLPAVPDIHERLQQPGARVADVACGGGWASIEIARAYPQARIDGYDVDPASLELATANAADAGVSDRVTFHRLDASAGEPPAGGYDLVCVFEAIHDMSQPVAALSTMRAMAAGPVLVMDERTEETFTAPASESERLLYGYSLFCCLPAGMSETPTEATGTVMRPATLQGYARAAGFADATVLPIEHDTFRFYRLA